MIFGLIHWLARNQGAGLGLTAAEVIVVDGDLTVLKKLKSI